MSMTELMTGRGTALRAVVRATVSSVGRDGTIEVVQEGSGGGPLICELLETSVRERLSLEPGDSVLVWVGGEPEGRAVVLGRIVPGRAPGAQELERCTPDELVIEAKKNLTFKCGDGSFTIREDGKILIKGKDLVSHATRLNRIKGGVVQIN